MVYIYDKILVRVFAIMNVKSIGQFKIIGKLPVYNYICMKFHFFAVTVLLSTIAWSQKPNDQYSIEAAYGFGASPNPGVSELGHYEFAFRYMIDEYWGIKFDFGADRFRTGDSLAPGSDYKRYSVQGVYNLGRALNFTNRSVKTFNILAHGGVGLSTLTSPALKGTDKIGNIILGVTPQYYLSDSFALMADTSMTLNFAQQNNFDGIRPPGNRSSDEFTGKLFTFSLGITYYFGRNKSNADWR
jgi:hypothetical protein